MNISSFQATFHAAARKVEISALRHAVNLTARLEHVLPVVAEPARNGLVAFVFAFGVGFAVTLIAQT